MSSQLELPLNAKAPKIGEDEIGLMIAQLRGNGWRTASQLGAKTAQQRRLLRAIANASGGRIVSYPGSPGYKLFDECLPHELAHADGAIGSQIRALTVRRVEINYRMHARGVVFPSGYTPTNA